MTRYLKWIGIVAAVLLILSCFTPWFVIDSRHITISGVDTTGTNFGKPGYFHFLLAGLFIICSMIPRIWAKRTNVIITALNMAWALKNFFVLGGCSGGECPVRQTGSWLMLLGAILMLVSSLFPDMKVPSNSKS